MTDELKPCPFCGEDAEHIHVCAYEEIVRCTNECCFVRPSITTELPEEAFELWNVRAAGASEGQATRAPFGNCRFRECDLPGQCRSEGACHHPATESAEITALRERIAGMEKDAARWRIAREFEYVTDFEVLGIDQRIDAGFAKEKQQ